jgi:CRP-like cAMP-binding protein
MAKSAAVPQEPLADDPIASLTRRLRLRDGLSDHEADVLRDAVERVEHAPAGKTLVTTGQPLTHSTLLVDGLVARFKDLHDGPRQITEIHVAGDFVDLHGFLLKRLEHNIGALTPVRLAYIPHRALIRITEREPHLTRLLWLSTQMDAAIQRERILSIGRRSALSRIAHLLCELYVRLEVVGQVDGRSYTLPLTQLDLADATGLTSVHVNRMLRELRDAQIVTFRSNVVEIHDLARLEQAAEFDRAYLFLDHQPR